MCHRRWSRKVWRSRKSHLWQRINIRRKTPRLRILIILRCACVSRCCGPRHRMFPYRTRKASE
ncbi:hypothetical protein PUN28_001959 [Cardiocondyla obscurior]|uniref:Uncharacterized protein n=1 Tax=Cardiocondyla obscurior TaxID=286306 RepID=A0AAW2GS41_9HYME